MNILKEICSKKSDEIYLPCSTTSSKAAPTVLSKNEEALSPSTFSIFSELWMQIKTISVIILTYYHFTLGKFISEFALENNQKTSKFFRIYNEIPTILLIVIIFAVILKPL